MSFYYAQINSENITVGISQLSGPVTAANMIPITEEQYNAGTPINCRYDATNNSWIPLPPQPVDATGVLPVTEI